MLNSDLDFIVTCFGAWRNVFSTLICFSLLDFNHCVCLLVIYIIFPLLSLISNNQLYYVILLHSMTHSVLCNLEREILGFTLQHPRSLESSWSHIYWSPRVASLAITLNPQPKLVVSSAPRHLRSLAFACVQLVAVFAVNCYSLPFEVFYS